LDLGAIVAIPDYQAERERLELEKLRAETAQIRSASGPAKKSPMRVVSEWLFAGGAILGLGNLAATVYQQADARQIDQRLKACERAVTIVTDDKLNEKLTDGEQDKLMDDNLRILQKCGKDIDV
jgi:hypothetical protein